MEKPKSEFLDGILGQEFKVLDDGFIRVVDYMGNDESIVQAARVSYGKGTKSVSDDRALIRYLVRNRHTSPLEMCEIKLHVRVPMDTWRQWIRHRSASVNEYSTRYSEAIDSKQKVKYGDWRMQATTNKQGSGGKLPWDIGVFLTGQETDLHALSDKVYKTRLLKGVAREQARKDLPLSTYTEAYWKIDLHNLMHFLSLRMDGHAQQEIRDYANCIGYEIVKGWVPFVWEAFLDYRFQRPTISSIMEKTSSLIFKFKEDNDLQLLTDELVKLGILRKTKTQTFLLSPEGTEVFNALELMGFDKNVRVCLEKKVC